MLTPDDARQALTRLFHRRRIADLPAILKTLETTAPMTAFRRLAEVGSLSSYSHRGRYYTLPDIPAFDADGLWLHQGIGFSRHGTLKDTVPLLVGRAEAGLLHREMQARLQVRVHNTLLDLLRAGRLIRESVADEYLYLSAEPDRAHVQRQRRRSMESVAVTDPGPLSKALVVEVLVEVVHTAALGGDPKSIARQLVARGVVVGVAQVEQVFREYRLPEKKTAASRSTRSQR